MLSRIKSASLFGIDAITITIEVDAAKGLPCENIVGLPDAVIRESKSRIKSAIKNSGFEYPTNAYTINLAPADMPKEGAFFDLPIAAGILEATGQLPELKNLVVVGELSLNGDIKPIRGIISIAELVKKTNAKGLIIPVENTKEAQLIPGITILPLKNLKELPYLLKHPPKATSNTTPVNKYK